MKQIFCYINTVLFYVIKLLHLIKKCVQLLKPEILYNLSMLENKNVIIYGTAIIKSLSAVRILMTTFEYIFTSQM